MTTVIDTAQVYRRALLRRESAQMRRLVAEYGRIYGRLGVLIQALEAEVLSLLAAGEDAAVIYRAARFQALREQIEIEVARFGGWLDVEIGNNGRNAAELGLLHSRGMAAAVGGPAIMAEWNMLPTAAIETMLGFLADTSPLHSALTAKLGAEVGRRVGEALVEGVALGINPRAVARGLLRNIIREQLGVGLTWAMTTSRTAMLWSYREAWRMNALANPDIVSGYKRLSARDGRVCMGCVALDGQFFPLTQPLNDHHNGRCVMLSSIRGVADPDIGTGEDWFKGLDEAEQQRMMGPGKFNAWKAGEFDFPKLVGSYTDPVYGLLMREAGLRDILGDRVSQYLRRAA